MELKNKDYFIKWSRWYWYAIFLVLLNIVFPIAFEIIFIIEEYEGFLLMIPLVISLIVLTILFIKNIYNREEGFSVKMLIIISIIYFIYYFLVISWIVEIGEYYQMNDFISLLIIFPFGLGPFLLFVNFFISYKAHKNGVISANASDMKLTVLGILSILVSIFFPFFILLIFSFKFFASTFQGVGNKSKVEKDNEKKVVHCPKCGTPYKNGLHYCEKCGNRRS